MCLNPTPNFMNKQNILTEKDWTRFGEFDKCFVITTEASKMWRYSSESRLWAALQTCGPDLEMTIQAQSKKWTNLDEFLSSSPLYLKQMHKLNGIYLHVLKLERLWQGEDCSHCFSKLHLLHTKLERNTCAIDMPCFKMFRSLDGN